MFAALESLDQQKVQQFFRDMQQRFQGEYVVSFPSFRDAAEVLMPWLESLPETRSYRRLAESAIGLLCGRWRNPFHDSAARN